MEQSSSARSLDAGRSPATICPIGDARQSLRIGKKGKGAEELPSIPHVRRDWQIALALENRRNRYSCCECWWFCRAGRGLGRLAACETAGLPKPRARPTEFEI